jgi:hypothetical protein
MSVTNITGLRDELLDVFGKLRSGHMKPPQAKEINNTAGKIIGTAKVQLEYCKMTGTKQNIPFLAK